MDREKLQKDVERAIHKAADDHRGVVYRDYGPEADAAIAAAEPHIRADERRKVLALISEALDDDLFDPVTWVERQLDELP